MNGAKAGAFTRTCRESQSLALKLGYLGSRIEGLSSTSTFRRIEWDRQHQRFKYLWPFRSGMSIPRGLVAKLGIAVALGFIAYYVFILMG